VSLERQTDLDIFRILQRANSTRLKMRAAKALRSPRLLTDDFTEHLPHNCLESATCLVWRVVSASANTAPAKTELVIILTDTL